MKKNKVYVVRKGHNPGIYKKWDECEKQIKGFPSAEYRSFPSYDTKNINNYLKGKNPKSDKWYAVKRGRSIGVYQTWEECQKQIAGFENADFCSFETETQAYQFLGVKNKKELLQLEMQQTEFYDKYSDYINVYVDGSYDYNLGVYSAAFVVVKGDKAVKQYARIGHVKEAADTIKSLAGELSAAMSAVQFVAKQYYAKIMLYHDNLSIRNLLDGTEIPKNKFQEQYVSYMEALKRKFRIKIEFSKVKAHNGNRWNELADNLAKEEIVKYKKLNNK